MAGVIGEDYGIQEAMLVRDQSTLFPLEVQEGYLKQKRQGIRQKKPNKHPPPNLKPKIS